MTETSLPNSAAQAPRATRMRRIRAVGLAIAVLVVAGLAAMLLYPRWQARKWAEELATTPDAHDALPIIQQLLRANNSPADQVLREFADSNDRAVFAAEHRVVLFFSTDRGQPYTATRWSANNMSPHIAAKFANPRIVENLPEALTIAATNTIDGRDWLFVFSYRHTGYVGYLTADEFARYEQEGFWNRYVRLKGHPIAGKRQKGWSGLNEEMYRDWKHEMEQKFGGPAERLRQTISRPVVESDELTIGDRSAPLQCDGQGRVISVDLMSFDRITADHIRQLVDFQELHTLTLQDSMLTEDAWSSLSDVEQLRRLSLVDSNVTDETLKFVASLTGLQHLRLSGCQISSAGLEWLRELQQLETLDLGITLIDDSGLAIVGDLITLQTLDLNGTSVSDAGIAHLTTLKDLSWLSLSDTQVTDAGLAHLAEMPRLKYLYLQETAVNGTGLQHLAGAQELRFLHLNGTSITDESVEHLITLSGLTHLMLSFTQLTDAAVSSLKKMTQLEKLKLTRTQLSKDGIERLHRALPDCEIEYR